MNILALDPSKGRTGWAILPHGADKPVFGSVTLGSEYTSQGAVFAKLHETMANLHSTICRFDHVYFEDALDPRALSGKTTLDTLHLSSGLRAHVMSFGHAYRLRIVKPVAVEQWRPEFIGRMESSDAKAAARARKKAGDAKASARDTLKALTMQRCATYGLKPRNNDEADALGILDYVCSLNGITPPWRRDEVLRPILTGTSA